MHPNPALAPPLDGQLCFALYSASMAMSRRYKPLLDALGITYPQYLVLHALWEEDGRTIGAIAARLALASSTVTPLVKRLAAVALVTRERNPVDERQVHVRLTQKGLAMRADAGCLTQTMLARTGLSLDRMTSFTEQVQAIRRALTTQEDSAAP